MHASSLENMNRCIATYLLPNISSNISKIKVIDIGGADVDGSYADFFQSSQFEYQGVDLEPSAGVSVVLDDPYKLPFETESVDLVISGQMLEHCEFFWLTFAEMNRVLKKEGMIFLIAPSGGPINKSQIDCYRFFPDAFRALSKYAKCHTIDLWHDNRGPWNDLVGVFSKTPYPKKTLSYSDDSILARKTLFSGPINPEYDIAKGTVPYLNTLEFLHRALSPINYLEIGIRQGKSLSLAKCSSVGVDPNPGVSYQLAEYVRVVELASDEFFETHEDPILRDEIDFAFIDGMHLFEYALRDFMNIERHAGPGTVVVIDDIFPNHIRQAQRERTTAFWTGDVWKLHEILNQYRPDLTIVPLDTHPTGLLLICGLNPKNEVLWEQYNPIITNFIDQTSPPDYILNRDSAICPESKSFKTIAQIVKLARVQGISLRERNTQIRKQLVAARPAMELNLAE